MSNSINRGEDEDEDEDDDEDEDTVSKIPLMKSMNKRFYQNIIIPRVDYLKMIEIDGLACDLFHKPIDGATHPIVLLGLQSEKRQMDEEFGWLLFGLVNTLLENSRNTAEKDLSIQRYAVIPLSPNSGLIGWVPNCDTLHLLIRSKEMLERSAKLKWRCLSMLCKIVKEMTWQGRTNYTRSLAVMSMVYPYLQSIGFVGPGIALNGLTMEKHTSIASAWLTLAVGLKSFSHCGFLVNLQQGFLRSKVSKDNLKEEVSHELVDRRFDWFLMTFGSILANQDQVLNFFFLN
ncbi:unnamed protein product [Camellia sinensis]